MLMVRCARAACFALDRFRGAIRRVAPIRRDLGEKIVTRPVAPVVCA